MKRFILLAGCLIPLIQVVVFGQTVEKLSLADAITIAVKNNPDIQRARKEVEAAEGRVLQAAAIPKLELSVQFDETPTNLRFHEAGQRTIGITQPIEFPGKIGGRIAVAEKDAQIARHRLDRTIAFTTADVRKAYSKAVFSRKLVTNFESMIQLLGDFQEIVRTRYEARLTPLLEVIRAKVELAKAGNQLIEARRDCQNDLASLNQILGLPGSSPLEITNELVFTPLDVSLDSVIAERRRTSAALLLADAGVDRQRAAASLAKKSILPDFSIGLSFQRMREQPPFNANDFNGTTGTGLGIDFGLSIPLWFCKGPKGESSEAKANLAIAGIIHDTVNRNMVTAIERAYRDVMASENQVKLFQQSLLRDIEDELQAGIMLYRNNQLDAMNLIDIYRTYASTKAEYYQALYNYHLALADLQTAGEENQGL